MKPHVEPTDTKGARVREVGVRRPTKAMLNDGLDRVPATRRARVTVAVMLLPAATGVAGFSARAQSLATFWGMVFDATNRAIPGATLVHRASLGRLPAGVQDSRIPIRARFRGDGRRTSSA